MAHIFASTLDHFVDMTARFDGASGMSTVSDPTPRARGRVVPLTATEFGHDLRTLQARQSPYIDNGGYAVLSPGARIYLDSGGAPEVNLDFRVGLGDSAVLCTFTENSVLITLDGDEEGATTHALPLPLDTWKYVNVFAWLNGPGASWLIIFIDGTAARVGLGDYDYSAVDLTYGGAETLFTSYRWWGASAYADDLIINDTSFVLGCEGYCLMPTGNGVTVEVEPVTIGSTGRWECSTGSTMWSLVDESPTPATTDYITALGEDYAQSFTTGASAAIPLKISGKLAAVSLVNTVALARANTAQPDPTAPGFDSSEHPEWREIGIGQGNGSNLTYTPGTSWAFYDGPSELDALSNPWTRATAVAAQPSVNANASTAEYGLHQVPYENDIDVAQVALEIYIYAGAAVVEDDDIICIA